MTGSVHSLQAAPRRLSAWLLAGLIAMPILFVWVLLRPGYSNGLRLAGFTFLAVSLIPAMVLIIAR